MELPNRKQRRAWDKQLGLLDKKRKASFSSRIEMLEKTNEQGKLIHASNTERNLRSLDEQKEKRNRDAVDKLIENGVSLEDALKQINLNS